MKPELKSEYCQALVPGTGTWGWLHKHQCSRKAKADGFCTIHHPDTIKKRKLAREAEDSRKRDAMRVEYKERKERERRADCFPILLEALQNLLSDATAADLDNSEWSGSLIEARAAIKKATL